MGKQSNLSLLQLYHAPKACLNPYWLERPSSVKHTYQSRVLLHYMHQKFTRLMLFVYLFEFSMHMMYVLSTCLKMLIFRFSTNWEILI